MNIYIIPSILAFIFTCAALIYTSKKKIKSKPFYAMVLIFVLHHSCEAILLLDNFKGIQTAFSMKVYYSLTVLTLLSIMIYSLEVSQTKRNIASNLIIVASALLTVSILFSNKIIAGNYSISYSSTAIKGPFYALFQAYGVIGLLTIVTILLNGYKTATTHLTQIRCAYILLAFSPLILSCFLVLAMMSVGIMINATIILPITISVFLFIIIKGESIHKLTDLRRFMPFSPERKTSQEIMELYSSYAQDEISYRDCMAEIEKQLVLHKYSKSDNNASATAKSMGMPRSSLYSIFNRLKIDIKDQ